MTARDRKHTTSICTLERPKIEDRTLYTHGSVWQLNGPTQSPNDYAIHRAGLKPRPCRTSRHQLIDTQRRCDTCASQKKVLSVAGDCNTRVTRTPTCTRKIRELLNKFWDKEHVDTSEVVDKRCVWDVHVLLVTKVMKDVSGSPAHCALR